MVASMNLVKAPPLLRRQGTQDRMIQHPGTGPEPLFGIGQRGIHGDQSVVEPAQRIVAESVSRRCLSGRLNSRGKRPNPRT